MAYKNVREHLVSALQHDRTQKQCDASILAAIAAAPKEKKVYVANEWLETAPKWGLYYRCHSPFLLQHLTAVAVTNWHTHLKREGGAEMLNWTLFQTIYHLTMTASQAELKTIKAAADWRTTRLSHLQSYKVLVKFPIPVQLLIAKQQNLALKTMIENETPEQRLALKERVEVPDSVLRCTCEFWKFYKLPCQHIWLQSLLHGDILKKDDVAAQLDRDWQADGSTILTETTPTAKKRKRN